VFFRNYIPISNKNHANINLQLRLEYITRSLLGQPEFNIAGSRLLRGYKRGEIEGNGFALLNIEWLEPILGRDTLCIRMRHPLETETLCKN